MSVAITLMFDHTKIVSDEIREKCDLVVRKTAFDIEAEAKQNAPVKSGYLKASIQTVDEAIGDAEAEVVASADYAAYVEYGTSRAGARPYMTPAVEAIRPEFEAAIAQALKI